MSGQLGCEDQIMNDIYEMMSTLRAVRRLRSDPIPDDVLDRVLQAAAWAPTGGNMQPWRVIALAGERVEDLRELLRPRMATELPKGEGVEYVIYPQPMAPVYRERSFHVGELLYQSIDVPREDKPARYRQYGRNYEFFGAPVALFFAREKDHGAAQWADIGGYLQTVALLARGHGLHTCPQQAWVSFHKTVRAFLDLPDHLMIYSGMALGYEDPDAPINRWRAPRALLEDFATFDGFES